MCNVYSRWRSTNSKRRCLPLIVFSRSTSSTIKGCYNLDDVRCIRIRQSIGRNIKTPNRLSQKAGTVHAVPRIVIHIDNILNTTLCIGSIRIIPCDSYRVFTRYKRLIGRWRRNRWLRCQFIDKRFEIESIRPGTPTSGGTIISYAPIIGCVQSQVYYIPRCNSIDSA